MRMLMILLVVAAAQAGEFPAWMSGSWRLTTDGETVEEHWTTAAGGLMLGMNRTIDRAGKPSFEFLRIERRGGSLAYLAMPSGRPPTTFPLKSLENRRVVFENLKHDYPQRILYWRDAEKLCARVEGIIDGKVQGEQWCWTRF